MAVYLVDFENVTSAGISGIQKLTKDDKVYIFYSANASSLSFAAHLNLLSSPAEVVYYNVSSGGKNALDFQLSSFLGYLICQGEEKKFCIISNDKGFEYVRSFWERSGIASDITINGAPSINRFLVPIERPVTSRIQQDRQEEADDEKPVMIIEKSALLTEAALKAENEPDVQPPKKRGRPKGGKSVASKETDKPKTSAKKEKNAAKSSAKPHSVVEKEVPQNLKAALAKADITDKTDINDVLEALVKSAGKQQFYFSMIKIFGMERGAEVYKAVRPEYTNLIKTVK